MQEFNFRLQYSKYCTIRSLKSFNKASKWCVYRYYGDTYAEIHVAVNGKHIGDFITNEFNKNHPEKVSTWYLLEKPFINKLDKSNLKLIFTGRNPIIILK